MQRQIRLAHVRAATSQPLVLRCIPTPESLLGLLMTAVVLQYTGVPHGFSPRCFGEPGCPSGIQVQITLGIFPEALLESRWAANPGDRVQHLKHLL